MCYGLSILIKESIVYFPIRSYIDSQYNSKAHNEKNTQKHFHFANSDIIILNTQWECAIETMRNTHNNIEIHNIGIRKCKIASNDGRNWKMTSNDGKNLKCQRLEISKYLVCQNLY